MLRYLTNWLLVILPVSGFFKFKKYLFRLTSITLGNNSCVNGHTWFYGRGKIEIGENTWVGPRCRFYSDESVIIAIGKNCDIAPEVAFVTGSHEIGYGSRRAGRGFCKPIVVEDGCWVGARATIHGGVTIGKGAVIGSGTLVIKDIPPNCVVVGIPAKIIRYLEVDSEES